VKLLAVESTSMAAGAALIQEDKLIGEIRTNHKKTHSEQLLPMIDHLLQMCECPLSEIDVLAVSLGPGSFTGIRIGVATVKGLAQALDKPVVGVDSLEALAWQANTFQGQVVPLVDAQRKLVYTAGYQFDETGVAILRAPDVLHIQELLKELVSSTEELFFLGDAMTQHREIIKDTLGNRARFALPLQAVPSASSLAQCAILKAMAGETVTAAEIQPIYLRTSQAEKVFQQRQLLKETRKHS